MEIKPKLGFLKKYWAWIIVVLLLFGASLYIGSDLLNKFEAKIILKGINQGKVNMMLDVIQRTEGGQIGVWFLGEGENQKTIKLNRVE